MENNFKLSLKQNDEVIMTSVFDATQYSDKTLSSIDVRNVLPNLFRNINQIASLKKFNYNFENYNLMDYYLLSREYLGDNVETKLKKPEIRSIEIETTDRDGETRKREIKGVELLLGFYINDKTIFERTVYVEKYNRNFRFSVDLYMLMKHIEKTLLSEIKKSDVVNIYNENREYFNV